MTAGQGGLVSAWYRGAWWLWLLRPLEWLFRLLASFRRGLYRRDFLRVYRAPVPVVVVGNITVGGTGKTPIVIALVEALQAAGLKPGVVSRGYGASGDNFPYLVSSHSAAKDCGDEPLLIFRRTGCPCVVSPNRVEAVRALLVAAEVDIVVSDDGLQHYALGRDMEIAVLDAEARLGNGFCLPAGPLREPPSRLSTVDALLYRGSKHPDNGVQYITLGLVNLVTGEQRPLAMDSFPAAASGVYAVAGIGRPQQFFDTLEAAAIRFETRVFDDHHAYVAGDFAQLGDRPIIMTEKDAVKCGLLAGENAWYLQIAAVLPASVTEAVIELARPQ